MFFFTALLVVSTAGCVNRPAKKQEIPEGVSAFSFPDTQGAALLQAKAERFTQAMFKSFQTGDFKYWKESLQAESPANSPLIVDENRFQQMRLKLEKDWGKFVKCHYLGALDQSVFRDHIWKCTFESETADKKIIRLEELFVVRCTQLKGKMTFTGFGFRFFNRPGFRDQVINLKKGREKNEKIDGKTTKNSGLYRRIHKGAGDSTDCA
jgi:hypothetical protein